MSVHRYITPKIKNVFDSFRNMQPIVDDMEFYTNGYYAIKKEILLLNHPTLYVKIEANERDITHPDLEKLISNTGKLTKVVLRDTLIMKSCGEAEVIFDEFEADEDTVVKVNAEFVALFTKARDKRTKKYHQNRYRDMDFYLSEDKNYIVIKVGNEYVGLIAVLKDFS